MAPGSHGFLPCVEGVPHGRLRLTLRLREMAKEQDGVCTEAAADLSSPAPIGARKGALRFDELALDHGLCLSAGNAR